MTQPVRADVDRRERLEAALGTNAAPRRFDPFSEPLVLFGAGTLGRECLARLRSVGIEPVSFAEDAPRPDATVDGLPVVPAEDAASQFGSSATFVIAIANRKLGYLSAAARLSALGCRRVEPFLALACSLPEAFLPHYFLAASSLSKSATARARLAFDAFADERSRDELVAHLRFRATLDFGLLPPAEAEEYFSVVPSLGPEAFLVDCGAFDGDTIRLFLERQANVFGRVVAFEPDPANFERLRVYVEGLPGPVRARIQIVPAAVGARTGTARLHAMGSEASAIDGDGDVDVRVVALDEELEGLSPTVVKIDVEGAELDVLAGARGLLAGARPHVAACVYHRPEHLWEVPLRLAQLLPDHKVVLRTEGNDGFGVVCYAIAADPPRARGRQ